MRILKNEKKLTRGEKMKRIKERVGLGRTLRKTLI